MWKVKNAEPSGVNTYLAFLEDADLKIRIPFSILISRLL